MIKKILQITTTLGIIIMCSCGKVTNRDGKYPNIIYILADDLGYGDLKSLNPDSRIPTPNMDKIVEEGIHFTDAHSSSAVCSPTRYGILTGRYAFRTHLKKGVLWGYSHSLIEPGRTTVASFLKENGYNTACIGKWHLGLDWARKDILKEIPDVQWNVKVTHDFEDNVDYTKPVKGGPSDHGFDYSLIIPASLDMSPYCYIRNGRVVKEPSSYTKGRNEETDGRGVFWRSGKMPEGFNFYDVLPGLVDSARHYIKHTADSEKPFFLYLALPSPHTPWLPVEPYVGQSGAQKYGDYVAMVDAMVGKVLAEVSSCNIDGNTLIIVTSDNGADWRPEDISETGHRANFYFKGRKADIYEGGHRIPFVARWPGVIPAGQNSDEVMCTTDLLRTLAGLIGKPIPENAGEDSYNFWPVFTGEIPARPIRDATIHHSLDGFFSIRKGKWKFTPHLGSGGFSQPTIIVPDQGEIPGTLYDIENDPKEENNLYKQYPEVVEELSHLIETYKSQGYSYPIFKNEKK